MLKLYSVIISPKLVFKINSPKIPVTVGIPDWIKSGEIVEVYLKIKFPVCNPDIKPVVNESKE